MMRQLCSGCQALAHEGVIHRDIAARNVLLFAWNATDVSATRAKISDFGMSVSAYGASSITVGEGSLPMRWMAPESLERRRFSEKSDVWSFGVMCWELLSDGKLPFASFASDADVYTAVLQGHRLEKPHGCDDSLWRVVFSCWAAIPSQRPTFHELSYRLSCSAAPAVPLPSLQHPLTITTLSGKAIVLQVSPSDIICSIKTQIFLSESVPPNQQRLIFKGQQLEDCHTLAHYGIQEDSKLVLALRLPGLRFASEVDVVIGSGRTIAVAVDVADTVLSLKSSIQQVTGIPLCEQRLIFGEKELEDDRTLTQYNITPESCIHLANHHSAR
jgi:serine/threonine protein kinase